jgi:hypothetical protein
MKLKNNKKSPKIDLFERCRLGHFHHAPRMLVLFDLILVSLHFLIFLSNYQVLSAFSPVGSRARDESLRIRDESLKARDESLKARDEPLRTRDEPLAQIQPRTATPTRSSSIARSMITAKNVDLEDDEFIRTTPSLVREENRTTSDTLGRLSISGRLSLQRPLPITPIQPDNGTSDKLYERFSTIPKESQPTIESRRGEFSLSNEYSRPIESSSRSSDSPILPELIRSLVEKSIAEAMREMRNDIQNLHVDLIKQSLAQQVSLLFAIS